jgi:hypothetical protein
MVHGPATLTVPGREGRLEVAPLALNALTPGAVPEAGLTGPLVAAGHGAYRDFNGKKPKDAIALVDLDSGRNWQAAAELGARAVVYVDDRSRNAPVDRGLFTDKFELTPVRFPRFLVNAEALRAFLGPDAQLDGADGAVRARRPPAARLGNPRAQDVGVFFSGPPPTRCGPG